MKLVLLHALPLDERMWEPQRAQFAEHEVVTPTLYGLGSSMDAWAAGVLAQVDGPLALVGASMGGYCALAIARRAPERVEALVLAGSRPDADSPERRAARDETIALVRREGAGALWERLRPRLFSEDAPEEVVERARGIALEQQPDGLVAALEAIRDRPDSTALAEQFGERFLGILGDGDPFVPLADARGLFAERVRVIHGAGHLPSLERPDEFNGELGDFLERWTT